MSSITRIALYQKLLDLAHDVLKFCEEKELNTPESFEQLSELLNQRSVVIDQINEINVDLGQKFDAQERILVKEIIEIDQASSTIIESNKFNAEIKLQKIKDGKRSNKAYQPAGIQTEGYFVDQKK